MMSILYVVLRLLQWPLSVGVLILSTLAVYLLRRPGFGARAPPLAKFGNWPIFGSWRYYNDRRDFCVQNQAASKSGHFSFHVGKQRVVSLSGDEGRKLFFESKDLHPAPGYAALFAGAPSHPDVSSDTFSPWFMKTLVKLMKAENFARNLFQLTSDVHGSCDRLAAAAPAPAARGDWRVFDPFEEFYFMVYQLTMRTVGCNDVADDPALLAETLRMFEGLDAMGSKLRFFFPWLPTSGYLKRMVTGLKLHRIFGRIADRRREMLKNGKRDDDPLQLLIEDEKADNLTVLQFLIGALFAGQINSGIISAYIPVYLAQDLELKKRIQVEIDAVINKFRKTTDQSAADVLDELSLEDWETEFPLIDVCLREAIRINLTGTIFRTNISGKDLPIPGSGELIPPGSHVIYALDDIHMDPAAYPKPTEFDIRRYLDGRDDGKKLSNGYIGWGSGRHPCLGMRFAKLEMNLMLAYLMAMFDFELADSKGDPAFEGPKPISRNEPGVTKPYEKVYLRYQMRAS